MNTVQIRIVTGFKAKGGVWFHAGEKYSARRLALGAFDIKTPFQLVDGNRSGIEIPYKNAVVLKEEKTYSQKQYDELINQRDEAMTKLDMALSDLANHGQKIVELQSDKASLTRTIERAIAHNEIAALPQDVVEALESFKRNGDDWDTVIRFMVAPMLQPEVNVLRKYASENGWLLISGMVNGYVISPEGEGLRTEISRIILDWWAEKQIEAPETELENLGDRVYNLMQDRQTTVQ